MNTKRPGEGGEGNPLTPRWIAFAWVTAMAAGAGSEVWQRALSQLQAKSWDVARVPTARHWLEFFYSCTTTLSAARTPQNLTRHWTPPLPKSVRLFVAECLVDAARLARLQQILSASSAGICGGAHAGKGEGQRGSRDEAVASLSAVGAAEDVTGVFLTASAPSEMVELLSHWCAADDAPRDVEQLVGWLREAAALMRFFTPLSVPHSEAQTPPRRRLYLTYPESLRVLHHGLCTVLLRPQATKVEHASTDVAADEEGALLAIWLLQNSWPSGADLSPVSTSTPSSSHNRVDGSGHKEYDDVSNALQETQMLLASRKVTQAWLLHLPVFLRHGRGNAQGGGDGVKKEGAQFIMDKLRCSFVCRLASELLPSTSSAGSPNVCVPFVDRLALVDEAAVHAMHEQLSSIATGDGGG
ncbi:hypothetical protein TraAM80_04554 [Trypanosoma rangeli]|uniref:Uncharacterized protein n=1 Tax=Trypanosoma rangeli TaxID=5698 RepID=A0A422NIS0_TRYRA|nr:uncharacterized protein TraAM80_04554 [Trypanosoma rangeli]RNF05355.1 hypothetical protein TraAM80_04554 [Trypanosoma rangeli]|eukprot:RNF05355.1 hypothetical protein TraAM80_04554 [Trypanosoma rangeli]